MTARALAQILLMLSALACLGSSGPSAAQGIYKIVGPDGKVTYTNTPPAQQTERGKSTEIEVRTAPMSTGGPAAAASVPASKAVAAASAPASSAFRPPAAASGTSAAKSANAPTAAASGHKSLTVVKPKVVIYTASWCPYCKAAKAFLAKRGISYTEIDTETLQGRLAFQKAGGGSSSNIPLILVGTDRQQRGFSQQSYEQLFANY